MNDPLSPPRRTWVRKFADAFRGMAIGIRGESSCMVHFAASVAVVIAASVLRATSVEWCLLALCISAVWSAELFNSALESMARAIDTSPREELRDALDIASGAVLTIAIGAAVVGCVVLGRHVAGG